jgi:hypothetical protein
VSNGKLIYPMHIAMGEFVNRDVRGSASVALGGCFRVSEKVKDMYWKTIESTHMFE